MIGRQIRAGLVAVGITILSPVFASNGQTPPSQSSEPRFALIIANEDYPKALGGLSNPHVDADNIAAALEHARFSVIVLHNQDKSQIDAAVSAFADRLLDGGANAVGFFYYSGHGASAEISGERHNYLLPVRTEVSNPNQLAVRGAKLDQIIEDLAASQAKAVFVVFDACRNTMPLPAGDKGAATSKGFVTVDKASGLYISFAAADGQTTPDDAVFSQELAQKLVVPGITADRAFTLANRAVTARRGSTRPPFVADGLRDDICFESCPTDLAVREQQTQALNEELRIFNAVQNSPSEGGYRLYLQLYPAGKYRPVAEKGLAALRDGHPSNACPAQDFVVYFEWDKYSLNSAAMDTIAAAVARARACKLQSVTITGHTDTSGSYEYNLALSQRMAQSVKDAMISGGIPSDLITMVGVGKADLARPTKDGVREPLNRRVGVQLVFG